MPSHSARFCPNVTFGVAGGDYATTVNVSNYYGAPLFPGYASDAIVEIQAYDAVGGLAGYDVISVVEAGSVHVDVAKLTSSGGDQPAWFSLYVRLVPLHRPGALDDARWISTEYTTEISTPSGSRTFFHNTLGPARWPFVGRMESAQLLSGYDTRTASLVMPNIYFGRRWPYVSKGRARIEIANAESRHRTALTAVVPARGLMIVSLDEAFPDLGAFLDGGTGILRLTTCNLLRKPWVWLESRSTPGAISIEHL
jgi:hypothetical protein